MEQKDEKFIQEQKTRIRKYLSLENVSILAGAGTSWHLGAPVIRTIPEDLKKSIKDFDKVIGSYFNENMEPSFEDFFNCLQADRFLKQQKGEDCSTIIQLMATMQEWLFRNCNTTTTSLKDQNDIQLQNNRYFYHEMFIKKILQRPSNLKRINLFTTNYDMAFDYALDNLGIHYINGFMGIHNRFFKPEVYDYDLYYPGQSISGKVHRAEKVLKYYKVHGSLSWINTPSTVSNTYGIQEIALGTSWNSSSGQELMVYPCVSKKSFTLDLPYSELFRQFSHAITQPQSVLFCIGYSFYDEHINDIINQALSIPSFTLIVVNYAEKQDTQSPIGKLRALQDKRIIILDETDSNQSAFCNFVKNMLPDLYEENEKEYISKTMKNLYNNSDDEETEQDG